MGETAYLILQNGDVFSGRRFGAAGDITAELVFTTAMTGYLETLTDPSYHGQMVLQTFPLIGNYGVIPEDFESPQPRLSAYIAREICSEPANFRSQGKLEDYLTQAGVIGLQQVDTRTLTKIIREYGEMNAAIVSELPADLSAFAAKLSQEKLGSDVYQVSSRQPRALNQTGRHHIVLWDLGYKQGMATELMSRGCRVTLMPAASRAADILAQRPDGILLSNGPGDPASYGAIIAEVGHVLSANIPMFGICLGHQIMALSQGALSCKLRYGHRGANQPVRDLTDGRLYITSQNHGYAIEAETLPATARLRFTNLNDLTCEGVDYLDRPAFSVQFHPEARGGPLDTVFLFDRFLDLIAAKNPQPDLGKDNPHAS
ncbi:MAG: carbamoyl phosphate synthase small subunit [Clostridia bacterium]|nr:carbamoyl phosphate synthase small subunit [Clostridia bacterium]